MTDEQKEMIKRIAFPTTEGILKMMKEQKERRSKIEKAYQEMEDKFQEYRKKIED